MSKTVTFSFNSSNYEGTEATETFSFKQLSLDENTEDEKALEIAMDKISSHGFGINLIFLAV